MQVLLSDLRYAFRMLMKRPGFTAVAVIALALGIGVNTAIFSVVNNVLFQRLPFENPERLAMLWMRVMSENRTQIPLATAEFVDFSEQNQVFEQMAAGTADDFTIVGGNEPAQVNGARVSASLFPLLGVEPLIGRLFTTDEEREGNNQVVILSHGLWQRRFGSDPGVLGQTLLIYHTPPYVPAGSTQRIGGPCTIIGVLPANFELPELNAEMWVPYTLDRNQLVRSQQRLRVVARLKPGLTLTQGQADMDAIANHLEQLYPVTNKGKTAWLVSLRDADIGDVRPAILVLFASAGLVLLICCANVANLLLARASERDREIALRMAIGATRLRLVRQLLTESALLSLIGGVCGLMLAYWGMHVLTAIGPRNIPRLENVRLDGGVLMVTLGISLLTGLIFGMAPALHASKPDLNESLKESSRTSSGSARRNRLRSMLVVFEVTLALMLLIGAGLIAKSFLRLQNTAPGFNPHNVLTVNLALPISKYAEPSQQAAFYRQLLDRVRSLPGVQSAGAINILPMIEYDQGTRIALDSRPEPSPGEAPFIRRRLVSPDYFRTMGIAIVEGRDFTEGDLQTPQLIINESMARRYWPDQSPIGRRVRLGMNTQSPWIPIVGVATDSRQYLNTEPDPTYYLSDLGQLSMTLVMRTFSDPSGLAGAVRQNVRNVDKDQPVSSIMTMEDRVSNAFSMKQARFHTLLLMTFAILALVLATVGIYGVISYSVTQRTREIGIRMALGAQQRDILKLIIGHGLLLALVGIVIGLAGAFALTRLLSSLLFGVRTTDLLIFVGTAGLLAAVATLASYIPARRATKVDPMIALRYQ